MARNGNSNKGKKYIKLRGNEIAAPENEVRARAFLEWYGANAGIIRDRLIYGHLYDDELATDTMLGVYDCIAYKGLDVRDYKYYFLRAYHTNYLASQKRKNNTVSFDTVSFISDGGTTEFMAEPTPFNNARSYADTLAAPDYNYEAYELAIDTLNTEITEYVRANYDPAECSLFEIYIGLQPEISYKKLARMLGFPVQKVWPVIGAIKKDIVSTFTERKDYFLSSLL